MGSLINISRFGLAWLPAKFDNANAGGFKRFLPDKDVLNQAGRYVRLGGNAVLSGQWEVIDQIAGELAGRLATPMHNCCVRRSGKELGSGVYTLLSEVPSAQTWPPAVALGLLGEVDVPPWPVALPLAEARKLNALARSGCSVPAISADLLVPPDVLAPRSNATIELLVRAISETAASLPDSPHVLDMGCGSGVLTVAALQRLAELRPIVTASDILPEALAVTRLNLERCSRLGLIDGSRAMTARAGDLFQQLDEMVYDLIIFNAPWVIAPSRNRAELALNDAGQQTIRRFLRECPQHLSKDGQLIVGYSDNSGVKAVENLELAIAESGLTVVAVAKDRIKTYRADRSWQGILAYRLMRAD